MKTILHGNVDGFELCLGFADATRDPVATENRVKLLMLGLPEQQAYDDLQDKIKARFARIGQDFKAVFGRDLDELRTQQEAAWYGNARKAAEFEVESLTPELQRASAALEAKRNQIRDENEVFFNPGAHEAIISDDDANRLIPVWTGLADHEQMTMTGEIVADYRGCIAWDSEFNSRKITKLNDRPTAAETLDEHLTDEQRYKIAEKQEAKRVATMSAAEKASELASVIDSLAARAAAMKDQEIIKGMATDQALRASQAWYQEQKQAAEKKYA